jgi:mannose-6-phosphate isomerase-like protein (cupin superfamily)
MDNIIEIRPWGYYEILENRVNYKVKHIHVNANQKLSYQSHTKRAEHWFIISGTALVTIEDIEFDLVVGESVNIEIGKKHRVQSLDQDQDLDFIEIQTGTYFGEDDITRYEDDYGRA